MDEKLSIFTLIDMHWRKFLIVFFICFGSGLAFSTKHLVPIFMDLIVVNPHVNDQVSNKPPHPPLIIPPPEPENYQVYLPVVSRNDPKEELALIQESGVQTRPAVDRKDPILDINFEDGSPPITLFIDPAMKQNHAITPVEISFLAGEQCIFGDGHACIYEFLTSSGNRVLFVSVHSGLGGEGDELRNLLEGTGINQGLFEPAQVQNIARSLSGSVIKMAQGDKIIEGLALTAVTRITPEHFTTYTSLPIEEALDYAVQISSLDPALLNQDLLVIETCGWRLPGEAQIEGLKDTSNSVYLAMISLENLEGVKD